MKNACAVQTGQAITVRHIARGLALNQTHQALVLL